ASAALLAAVGAAARQASPVDLEEAPRREQLRAMSVGALATRIEGEGRDWVVDPPARNQRVPRPFTAQDGGRCGRCRLAFAVLDRVPRTEPPGAMWPGVVGRGPLLGEATIGSRRRRAEESELLQHWFLLPKCGGHRDTPPPVAAR